VVESSGLLNRRRALKLYRGFESLPLRQIRFNRLHIRRPRIRQGSLAANLLLDSSGDDEPEQEYMKTYTVPVPVYVSAICCCDLGTPAFDLTI
jgi:hypothetical protein